MSEQQCCFICQQASIEDGCAVPVNDHGEIVDWEYDGDWVGMPVCEKCYLRTEVSHE